MVAPGHRPLHPWDVSPSVAVEIQKSLAGRVILRDTPGKICRVAGIDVGFEDHGKIARAGVVVLEFPSLELIESRLSRRPAEFPYIPGLLSFRELPVVLEAYGKLQHQPDLILCDGQGIAHPRRLGLASHLGVWLDVPVVGVAKSRLLGRHNPVPDRKGDWSPLLDRDEVLGAVLRTRQGVQPVFVSPGHRISLPTAIHYTLACTTRFRLPETTRQAHALASRTTIARR